MVTRPMLMPKCWPWGFNISEFMFTLRTMSRCKTTPRYVQEQIIISCWFLANVNYAIARQSVVCNARAPYSAG